MNRDIEMRLFLSIGLLYIVCVADVAFGFDFEPTEFEFQNWDERCKALYVSTDNGAKYGFEDRVPRDVVIKWRSIENAEGSGAWHYCAGIAMLTRTDTEFDPVEKARNLERAIRELDFTHRNARAGSRGHLESTVQLAMAYRRKSEYPKALDLISALLRGGWQYPPAYTAQYLLYKDTNQKEKAFDSLLKADKELDPPFAEIKYFLGLEYFARGDLVNARKYADEAYGLGYPLQGLKLKLEQVGQ